MSPAPSTTPSRWTRAWRRSTTTTSAWRSSTRSTAEEILDKVLKGHGAVGNDHPISPANRYYNTELEARPYDPEKAKFYLKQAGLKTI